MVNDSTDGSVRVMDMGHFAPPRLEASYFGPTIGVAQSALASENSHGASLLVQEGRSRAPRS